VDGAGTEWEAGGHNGGLPMKIEAALIEPGAAHPRLAEVELGAPGPGEVLVRVVATGICHTDIKAASAESAVPRPVVLGHEGAGIVEAIGPGVAKVKPGDHVVMTFASCGRCRACLEAEPACCHAQATLNFGCAATPFAADGRPVHGGFFGQSSFASFALAGERNLVKVRKDAPLELLGPLGCGIQTGAGAVLNVFALRPGGSLAVFGVGSVGLSAVMAARLAGAGRIIAVDRHPHRLALARELGADDAVLAADGSVAGEIMRLTGEGVDFSLDTTGVLPVMRQALDVLGPRGTCGFVTGPWDRAPLDVVVRDFLGRTIRGILQGGSNPDVFIPLLVDAFMAGRFPIDRLARFYPFAEIAQAFADSESGSAIKPILRMAS
jgi:aryl-alcohol dehydrogenase